MVAVLVLNAGSSSLKYQVVGADGARHLRGLVERIGPTGMPEALAQMRADVDAASFSPGEVAAVGHRVVHGGPVFSDPVLITPVALEQIDGLAAYAPLHNPPAVAGIRAALAAFPDVPHVAVFDTAYFAGLPAVAATYAIDASVAAAHGIKRYGAHGTSHRFVAGLAASLAHVEPGELRQIVLHLGNGASAAAIRGGRPVETSMGLTPLEGLVMGTRGGDLDPGVLLHLLRAGLSVDQVDDLLQHRSGLQGLAGRHDMRDLLSAAGAGDADAGLAVEVYVHRLRKYIGAYLAVLGGADQIIFTAGVGEHAAAVRAAVLGGLSGLGITLDAEANEQVSDGPRVISQPGGAVQVLVVPTDEEWEIARQVLALLEPPR